MNSFWNYSDVYFFFGEDLGNCTGVKACKKACRETPDCGALNSNGRPGCEAARRRSRGSKARWSWR